MENNRFGLKKKNILKNKSSKSSLSYRVSSQVIALAWMNGFTKLLSLYSERDTSHYLLKKDELHAINTESQFIQI